MNQLCIYICSHISSLLSAFIFCAALTRLQMVLRWEEAVVCPVAVLCSLGPSSFSKASIPGNLLLLLSCVPFSFQFLQHFSPRLRRCLGLGAVAQAGAGALLGARYWATSSLASCGTGVVPRAWPRSLCKRGWNEWKFSSSKKLT